MAEQKPSPIIQSEKIGLKLRVKEALELGIVELENGIPTPSAAMKKKLEKIKDDYGQRVTYQGENGFQEMVLGSDEGLQGRLSRLTSMMKNSGLLILSRNECAAPDLVEKLDAIQLQPQPLKKEKIKIEPKPTVPENFNADKHLRISKEFVDHLKQIDSKLPIPKEIIEKGALVLSETGFEKMDVPTGRLPEFSMLAKSHLGYVIQEMEKSLDAGRDFVDKKLLENYLELPLQLTDVSPEDRLIAESYLNDGKIELGARYLEKIDKVFTYPTHIKESSRVKEDPEATKAIEKFEKYFAPTKNARTAEVKAEIAAAVKAGYLKPGETKLVDPAIAREVRGFGKETVVGLLKTEITSRDVKFSLDIKGFSKAQNQELKTTGGVAVKPTWLFKHLANQIEHGDHKKELPGIKEKLGEQRFNEIVSPKKGESVRLNASELHAFHIISEEQYKHLEQRLAEVRGYNSSLDKEEVITRDKELPGWFE